MRSFAEELATLEASHLRRRLRLLETRQQPHSRLNGGEILNFSSNDYLGLASDPWVIERLVAAVQEWGAGSGASRLVCGTQTPHQQLEQALAKFKGTAAALSFSSGYAAAIGTLSALLQSGDIAIIDKLSHASLIDGAKMSGATLRIFPHNDLEALEKKLAWARAHLPPSGRILIVTESIFSMDGDRAPLREIVAQKERFGALLLVDEAHAVGLLGKNGKGLAAAVGVESGIDFHFGTLSKAIGLSGGYVAGEEDAIALILNRARSLIYTTAPPPALAAVAAQIISEWLPSETGELRRQRLWQNIRQLAQALDSPALAAWCADDPSSAIIPIVLGEGERALQAAQLLQEQGFLVPAIRYPTVPRQAARLRVTLSASHEAADIQAFASALHPLIQAIR